MSRVLGALFWAAVILAAGSWWRYDALTDDLTIEDRVALEPEQRPTRAQPFSTVRDGVTYRVKPRYDYEITGLVVSARDHDGGFGMHRLWNDHLNVADLCVVWGTNADVGLLREFEFRSGEFTCYFRTRSDTAWHAFAPRRLSNNHLLAERDDLREAIRSARVGDQVRIRGQLVEYGVEGGPRRGTSTTRTDTGDGACETIYVSEFEVLRTMDSTARSLYGPSRVAAAGVALLWLFGVARGRW